MPGFTLAPGADAATVAAATTDIERALDGTARDLADRVLIVVGEVTSNTVEHGTGVVTLLWDVSPRSVRIDVLGPGPGAVQILSAILPPDDAVRGRGLFLIRSLATSVEPTQGGVCIWFE